MRKVIILQARLSSSRLPKKVMAEISGKPVIAHIIERLKTARCADGLCVAIPSDEEENALAEYLQREDVALVRGSGPDVLGRYVQAAYQTQAEVIVRCTADNMLVSTEEIDRQLAEIESDPEVDYLITEGYPRGVTPETFTLKTLEKLDYLARHAHDREHVTIYLRKHSGPFQAKTLHAPPELTLPHYSLTLDTPRDLALLRGIHDKLYQAGAQIALPDVLALLEEDPKLADLSRIEVPARASA